MHCSSRRWSGILNRSTRQYRHKHACLSMEKSSPSVELESKKSRIHSCHHSLSFFFLSGHVGFLVLSSFLAARDFSIACPGLSLSFGLFFVQKSKAKCKQEKVFHHLAVRTEDICFDNSN